jgi:O-antigen/teichoic acid export membrane protein
MGTLGFVVLLVGVLAIAFGIQLRGTTRSREEWGVTAVAAFLGGFAASELFGAASTWGTALDGLYVLPALIDALAIGGLAAYGPRATRQPAA